MSRSAHPSGLTSIVAVGLDGEIGIGNELPWRLKSDLRFFKETTLGNVIIMGRKTYDSIGGCLKGRENIVLSHKASLFASHNGCHQSHSIGETLYLREKYSRNDAFIIGGAQTYLQFAQYVDTYLITIVKGKFPNADAFFDQSILNEADWDRREVDVERIAGGDDFDFSVVKLTHKNPTAVRLARQTAISEFTRRNHLLQRKELRRTVGKGLNLDQRLSLA